MRGRPRGRAAKRPSANSAGSQEGGPRTLGAMAWFRDRGEGRSVPEPSPHLEELDAAEAEVTPLVIPRLLPLDDAGQRRIDAALGAL